MNPTFLTNSCSLQVGRDRGSLQISYLHSSPDSQDMSTVEQDTGRDDPVGFILADGTQQGHPTTLYITFSALVMRRTCLRDACKLNPSMNSSGATSCRCLVCQRPLSLLVVTARGGVRTREPGLLPRICHVPLPDRRSRSRWRFLFPAVTIEIIVNGASAQVKRAVKVQYFTLPTDPSTVKGYQSPNSPYLNHSTIICQVAEWRCGVVRAIDPAHRWPIAQVALCVPDVGNWTPVPRRLQVLTGAPSSAEDPSSLSGSSWSRGAKCGSHASRSNASGYDFLNTATITSSRQCCWAVADDPKAQ